MELAEALGIKTQTATPRRQSRQETTDNLIKLVFQGRMNFSDIAKELGISRKTAYRYWNRWKQSEEAQTVDWEWWNLYFKVREVNPEKALECLTRIKHKMIVEKQEIKQDIREIRLEWKLESSKTNNQIHATPEPMDIP